MDLVPLLGYIYIFGLVIGLTLLFLRKIPSISPPEPILKLIDTFKPMIVSGLIAFGAFYAIIWLANKAACNLRSTQGTSRYEPFQMRTTTATASYKPPPGSPTAAYIPYVERAIKRLEKTLEIIPELTSDICGIVKEIENAYVSTKSGDVDESEFSLPRDQQEARRQARKERAAKIFATNRRLFAKKANTAALECFLDETEAELQTAAQELQTLLDDPDVQTHIQAYPSSMNALEFSSNYLNKSIELTDGFQGSPTPPSMSQPVSSLTGAALLRAVENLLQKEAQFSTQTTTLQQTYATVNDRVQSQYRKASRLQSGDVSSSDVKSSLSPP